MLITLLPTRVIQEELERALNAVEESIYDHVVDVPDVGFPLLRGRFASEQQQVALRHEKSLHLNQIIISTPLFDICKDRVIENLRGNLF